MNFKTKTIWAQKLELNQFYDLLTFCSFVGKIFFISKPSEIDNKILKYPWKQWNSNNYNFRTTPAIIANKGSKET